MAQLNIMAHLKMLWKHLEKNTKNKIEWVTKCLASKMVNNWNIETYGTKYMKIRLCLMHRSALFDSTSQTMRLHTFNSSPQVQLYLKKRLIIRQHISVVPPVCNFQGKYVMKYHTKPALEFLLFDHRNLRLIFPSPDKS